MAPSVPTDIASKTFMWIILVAVATVIALTTIAFFGYKHSQNTNVRLGEVYVFDAPGKYKKTLMYALILVLLAAVGVRYQRTG